MRRESGRDEGPDAAGVPALICYLAMTVKAVPNLERALLFASSHVGGGIGDHLRRRLSELGLGKKRSGEEILEDMARDWGEICPELGRSLNLISSATRERSNECRERSLSASLSITLQGALERAREYASRIHHPVIVLYAVGVLLPLVVSVMVPVLSLAGFGFWHLAIIFNCACCPLFVWLLGRRILWGRPRCLDEGEVPLSPLGWKHVLIAVGAGSVPPLVASAIGFDKSLLNISMLWAVAAFVSVSAYSVSIRPYMEWKSSQLMEEELPLALTQIGNRMLEGRPAEEALFRAADSCGCGKLRDLLVRAASRVRFGGEGLKSALFGEEGVLREVYSGMVRGALRAMVDLSDLGTEAGGDALLYMSSLIGRMREADREMRRMMGEVVSSMRSVATVFAPMIAGVTASIFSALSRARGLGLFGWSFLSPDVFVLAMGCYATLLCVVLAWFSGEVEFGRSLPPKLIAVALSVPLALMVFTASFVVGNGFMGMIVK